MNAITDDADAGHILMALASGHPILTFVTLWLLIICRSGPDLIRAIINAYKGKNNGTDS